MKPFFSVIILTVMVLTLASCGPDRNKELSEIKEIEKKPLFNKEGKPDKVQGDKMIKAYIDFVKRFPKDSLSPEFLFSASRIQVMNAYFKEAIETLDMAINNYPSYKRVPDFLFTKGNIYENNLHDLIKAKGAYEELIKKYPSHPFSRDAQVLIENLGKSPEELLHSILSKKDETDSIN